jgi:hypothetical protein
VIIAAQNDFQGGQGKEGNPDFGVGQPIHVYSFERVLNHDASKQLASW